MVFGGGGTWVNLGVVSSSDARIRPGLDKHLGIIMETSERIFIPKLTRTPPGRVVELFCSCGCCWCRCKDAVLMVLLLYVVSFMWLVLSFPLSLLLSVSL